MRKRNNLFSIIVATIFTITSTHSTFAMWAAGWGADPLNPIHRQVILKDARDHYSRYQQSKGHHVQYYADDAFDWEHTYSWAELGGLAVSCIPAGKIAQLAKSAAGKAIPRVIKWAGISFTTISITENDKKPNMV